MTTSTTTSITGIAANYYLVQDLARATAFWRDVMNLPLTMQFDQGAEFELPDGSAFGLWKPSDNVFNPSGGIMFTVPDAHAAVAYFRGRGVHIEEDVFEGPGCFLAFCQDSEGNDFMLHQSKS
ncbi:VOC family protein [bacterium]|nr:MAG: VOC family protein [bacterium]